MNLSKFNKKMAKKGWDLELVKGKGYFYWSTSNSLPNVESVMVPYFYQLSENTWEAIAVQVLEAIANGDA